MTGGILDRYIGRTVLSSMFMVLVVIVGLDLVFAFVSELNDLNGEYRLYEAVQYIFLSLPGTFYEFIPLACLVGCLTGLGGLASRSELVVMRAAGTSILRIVWSVLQPTILMILLTVMMGELVVPFTEKLAETRREVARSGAIRVSGEGHWYREGNTFIHFAAAESNGVLHSLILYEFDAQQRMRSVRHAERALYTEDEGWTLVKVNGTRIDEDATVQIRHQTQPWQSQLTPALLDVLFVDPDRLSLRGLYRYARYRAEQGLESANYWLSFWSKLLVPVSIISLVLVAISFIFGPLRDGTMGYRIFTGVLVGLVFKYSQDLLGPASLVFGFPPVLAILIPIAVCAGAGVVMLRKAG